MLTDLPLRYLLSVPSRRPDSDEMPLLVMMHGRGADAHDLADLAPLLDSPAGIRFVFPNAPRPFEAYPGMSFGWTWFEGWPPLHESILESRELLGRFLDEVVARYPTPPGKVVLAGFSQGALMALDTGLRRAGTLAAIAALSGGLYEQDLGDVATRARLPLFVAHGLYDDVVPIQYAQRARRVLEEAGGDVEYHEYPMSHQIAEEEIGALRAFVARVL